jgi:hypothetical protein
LTWLRHVVEPGHLTTEASNPLLNQQKRGCKSPFFVEGGEGGIIRAARSPCGPACGRSTWLRHVVEPDRFNDRGFESIIQSTKKGLQEPLFC